ncbi:MAG: proprotein convertase P-domain-containing protein, partial [Planctomycetota bacterium]
GEIWSRALWDIMNSIGREAANQVILESHFTLPAGATMPIAAEAVLLADVNLNGGANTADIRQAFVDRGILTEIPDAGLVNFDRDNYTIPDTIEIVVTDGNAIQPVEVTVESTSGDSETVMLTELAEFFYGGSINTAEGVAVPEDGMLQTAIGDTLTVTYNDPDNGLGGTTVANDTAGVTNTRFYPSDDVPVSINDNSLQESTIDITDVGYVADIDVELDITHTWDADLDVFLVSPGGTTVELFSDVGADGDNFSGTVLDDEATQSIAAGAAPFTGSFSPEGFLADFDDEVITGTWTLQIFDDAAGDTGTLNNWSLTIDVIPASAGAVNFDQPFYNVGDTVGFQVIDSNTTGGADVIITSGADSESITLLGIDVFNGTIPTAAGNPVPDDGILQVASGTPITIEYFDVDDGSGNPATDSDTAGIRNVIEFPSADVPVQIDDNTTVTSDLEITDDGIIGDIDVLVDITHTWDSDLDVTLISPGGERVDLFLGVGGSGDNFTQTILDDEAATSITAGAAPFTGRFAPVGNLTGLESQLMTGIWQLEITDNATGDTGTLNEWSLFIDVIPPERGQVSFDAPFYEEGETVGFSVFDTNTDGTADVLLTSSDGDSEMVTLTGGGPDFSATMATANAAPVAGDGILQVMPGGSITIEYMDTNDGSGNPATAEDTADIRNTIEYPSVDVPLNIEDNTTFTSEIVITDEGLARDVDVLLDITHTWDSDLDVFLIAPDGDRIELFQDVGGSGDNFTQTILDDEAEVSIGAGEAPFTGRFKPVGDLSRLEGETITGTWLLEITDDATGDTGTLNEWSLFIDVVPVPDADITIAAAADVMEGNTGTMIATFDVMLSEASTQTVTVDYATTTAGFANPAAAGADFVALMDTLTFDPGETMKTIEVEIIGEERIEVDEQFGIELTNASGGTIVGGTASGTIIDDDVFVMGTKMDIVTQDSPIESGLLGLTDTEYSAAKEIGWQPGAVNLTVVDTGIGGDLERDVVRLESGTLTAKVPIGFYRVQVTWGDPEAARDLMQVTTEGRVRNPVTLAAGQTQINNYRFAVTDGFLDLEFEDLGGSDDFVSVAAIQIVKRQNRNFRPTPVNPLSVPTTKAVHSGIPVGQLGDPHDFVFTTRNLPVLQTAFDNNGVVSGEAETLRQQIEDRGAIEETRRAQLLNDYLEESLLEEL